MREEKESLFRKLFALHIILNGCYYSVHVYCDISTAAGNVAYLYEAKQFHDNISSNI